VSGASLSAGIEEFQQKVLPASFYAALPAPAPGAADFRNGTYVWGYRVGARPPLYPGFTVEAQRGVPTMITYMNNLPNPPLLQKYLTVDQTLHWADPYNQMALMPMAPYGGAPPAVVHLHGGEVPSMFDGGPEQWFTPDGLHGPGFASLGGPANAATYLYPNAQEAATLWFHDHALGATRLNVYAGLAAFYLLRDPAGTGLDTGIPATGGLPAGPYEIEIAIQDRIFDTNGQLLFPDLGINPAVHPYWRPEFFGDTIVVNGKTWPYLNVEPRRYRFRLLNGSNARFYELRISPGSGRAAGLVFWQIGTDGGLLSAPVPMSALLLAPGERADVIVDFSGAAGQTLVVTNSAKAPYPNGAAADPQTVGQIMQFRVVTPLAGADTSLNPATPGVTLRPSLVRLATAGALAAGVVPTKVRQLTLNEVMGPAGPLEVLVNNTKWDGALSPTAGGITETPRVGSTEVWEIVNLTADAHPIHLHLVQFQLVNRQPLNVTQYRKAYNALFPAVTFNGVAYPGGVFIPGYGPPQPYNSTPKPGGNPDVAAFLQGAAAAANANEVGWKDTVIVHPGEVTRLVVRWTPQNVPAGGAGAGINLYPFDPTVGPGYVWHCHIIDHEDNEMMRPQHVTP